MKILNLIGKRSAWFPLLAICAFGPFLLAADSGLLSKQDLKSLISNAKSAQDHELLARHFDAKAAELEADSKEHYELAAQYRAKPTAHESKHPMSGETAGHCQYFADDLHKAAQRARQIAADHRTMAKQAVK